ncbi:MAG: ABC transporter permease [Anaerolineae bacterium]|jgi:simple sugar transport system permease protein|nr:ABC transporter permease [Anaerolineae bacterium]
MTIAEIKTKISDHIPYRLSVEKRIERVKGWQTLLITVGAVVVALLVGGVILSVAGGNPFATYAHIARASFGSLGVLSDTLVKATPLIFIGLACAIAFRMRLWNIGAEGQFYLGAFGASAVVLVPLLPEDAPKWLWLLTMGIAGMICGALWGAIPGLLKAQFKVNEVISTLMMNYIAIAFCNYFIFGTWSEGGFQMSPKFPKIAWLPRLTDYAKQFDWMAGLTTHAGFIIAVLLAVLVWFILYRSKWGYEIRLIGDNERAAEYAGIAIKKNVVFVMVLSGALAGLAGFSEVSGVVHRFQSAISPGYGFTGIIIAWLAKLNPWAVIPVSVLFGALILAGREIQPAGIPKMIQGIILVCLIASDFFLRYQFRITRKEAI